MNKSSFPDHTLAILCVFVCLALGTMVSSKVEAQDFSFPMHSQEDAPLGTIIITGNNHTDTTLIKRILGLRIGQTVTREELDDAWDRLEDSGYFRTVDVHMDEGDDTAIIRIRVEEDLKTYYGPLVRYDRRFKYFLGAWVEQRNFRGQGETLRLEASALYSQQGSLSWQRPWFLGRQGLSAQLVADFSQGAFVYRPTDFRKWDTKVELRQDWGGMFFASASLTYGQFDQRDTFVWQKPERGFSTFTDTQVVPAGIETHWVSEGSIGLDTRTNPYYPSRGVYLAGTARHWSSADFPSYLETTLDARFFLPALWKNHVLALRAWGRNTSGPAQLDNLLFFGGPETVRGEPYATRDGDHGYLLTAEYRIPLFLMPISPQGELVGVGIHFFADAGDAWFDRTDSGRAMQSAGAGLHLNLDTLQLRFEAARTREGHWGFEFMDKFNF